MHVVKPSPEHLAGKLEQMQPKMAVHKICSFLPYEIKRS
jgi:hypothetical protein